MAQVFPTMELKLTDPDYWKGFDWTFSKQLRQEREESAACKEALNQFRCKGHYNIEDCPQQPKTSTDEFKESFDYIKLLTLRDDNYDFETRYSGKLWVRDLFMKGQTAIL